MSKAQKKLNNKNEGLKLIDLTVEKRNEIFVERLRDFIEENKNELGITLKAELSATVDGIIPRISLVDLQNPKFNPQKSSDEKPKTKEN